MIDLNYLNYSTTYMYNITIGNDSYSDLNIDAACFSDAYRKLSGHQVVNGFINVFVNLDIKYILNNNRNN